MSTCPKCGESFTCDLESGKGHCWCFDLEIVASSDNYNQDRCLCKKCLPSQKNLLLKDLYNKVVKDK
jgi:hypothetical protein